MSSISVIVPIYNAEKYLNRCVDSILTQTFQDFELILVNDGSLDHCGSICEEYAKKDNRVRVIHQSNQGQAAARNHGVAESKSEWITFVDADDLIHPQMIEFLYRAVKETNCKISVCHAYEGSKLPEMFMSKQEYSCFQYIVNESNLAHWYSGNFDATEMSTYVYWIACCKLIYKNILNLFPFSEGRVYEDNAIVLKWLYTAENIAYCNNTMYFYYVNLYGTTKGNYSLKKLDWLWALEEQVNFYRQIEFYKMLCTLSIRYVKESVQEYESICQLLHNNKEAKRLRRKISIFWLQNRKKIFLSKSQKMDLLTRLYPKEMYFLWHIKNILVHRKK